MSQNSQLTAEKIRADIASVTNNPNATFDPDALLTDQGVDSLAMVQVVDLWRSEGHEVDFYELMGRGSLNEWIDYLTDRAES